MPVSKAHSAEKEDQTRNRLLHSAAEVFAEEGFEKARVREICRRADANVAAVNYHFGDKEKLYLAVLEHAHSCAVGPAEELKGLKAEEKLQRFIANFLARVFQKEESSLHGRLMAREMVEPTFALQHLVEKNIRPRSKILLSIISELLDGETDPILLRRCAQCVMGQCAFHHHARAVISRLFPDQKYDQRELDALAEHITCFSLAGIRACGKSARPLSSKNDVRSSVRSKGHT